MHKNRRSATQAEPDVFPWRADKYITLWLLLICTCLLATFAHAEHAYVEGNRVFLPVVESFPYDRSVELRLVPRTSPQELVLEVEGNAAGPVTAASAYYEGELLIVPEVWINEISYWAELQPLGRGRFRLDAFGRNQQQTIPGTSDYEHQGWEWIPGAANDIGVGADGSVWAVGDSHYGYDYGLYQWDGQRWYEQRGSALRVDVDPSGRPWVVNDVNEIYRLDRGRWERVAGAANDIGIGADGSVWAVGITERRGGYSIYRMGVYGWIRVEGSAVRIDVDPSGVPWVVNADDQIYRLVNGAWRRVPGRAKDIGIGADGSVWVIGADERAGGYGVYRFNGAGWDKIDGSARQISVGPDGAPWVVNRDGDIYRSWGY